MARSTLSAWTGGTWTASRRCGSTVYGELLNLCIWNKSNAGMGSLYRSKHELVFVYRVGTAPHLNMVELGKHGRNRTNVWDYASVNSMRGSRREDLALHPTVKPRAGCRCHPGRHPARRSRAGSLSRLRHDAARGRADRTAVPRARHRSGLCRRRASSAGRREPAFSRALKEQSHEQNPVPIAVQAPTPKRQQTPVGSPRDSSGNLGGRPRRSARGPATSAFEILLDKTLTITRATRFARYRWRKRCSGGL